MKRYSLPIIPLALVGITKHYGEKLTVGTDSTQRFIFLTKILTSNIENYQVKSITLKFTDNNYLHDFSYLSILQYRIPNSRNQCGIIK